MANRYMVRVYDCSFVQDYVVAYDSYFDTLIDAKRHAYNLMRMFGESANYEYTTEILIRTITIGAYEPIGYYEFDYMGSDTDLFDLVSDLDSYENLSSFTYHEMF